ncbi:MAG: NAD(P)-dependent oxidoreductase [Bacteroidota bacterium]|nr:NAD(P)-dependent oxidoreductase [Bacteroidota bacterium]
MSIYQDKIRDITALEDLLSLPSEASVNMCSDLEGDIMFLGVGGKLGPSLARMTKRACEEAKLEKRIYGVSLFESDQQRKQIDDMGIETFHGDLLDPDFIQSLPKARNVFFLAGMKFGSEENISLTWAVNSYMPALVADYFKESRIVAFSTGCVYPLVPRESGGSLETDPPTPLGEYAQSCLGRERMFEYGSKKYQTKVCLIRLNYSVELRYGVLLDIATKVKNREAIDLSMGYFNVIWQGDVNDVVLRSLDICNSPAKILNITGEEILSVREVALEFGKLFNTKPEFVGTEALTALLNNAGQAFKLFGRPKVSTLQIIKWIADWISEGRETLGKPTHYEVRDGKY